MNWTPPSATWGNPQNEQGNQNIMRMQEQKRAGGGGSVGSAMTGGGGQAEGGNAAWMQGQQGGGMRTERRDAMGGAMQGEMDKQRSAMGAMGGGQDMPFGGGGMPPAVRWRRATPAQSLRRRDAVSPTLRGRSADRAAQSETQKRNPKRNPPPRLRLPGQRARRLRRPRPRALGAVD